MNFFTPTHNRDYCRVCLQSQGPLLPCQTPLFFNDSSLTITEILNTLTTHNISDPPYYPIGICFTCKELVQTTLVLKIIFEKTNALLTSFLTDFLQNKQHRTKRTLVEIDDSSNDNVIEDTNLKGNRVSKNNSNNETHSIINNTATENDYFRKENISTIKENGGAHICKEKIKTEINIQIKDESSTTHENQNVDLGEESVSSHENEDIEELNRKEFKNSFVSDNNILSFLKKVEVEQSPILKKSKKYRVDVEKDDTDGSLLPKYLMGNVNFPFNRTSMKLDGKALVEQNYLCPICQKELPDPNELKKHASSHRILRKYLKNFSKITNKTKFFTKPRVIKMIPKNDNYLYICPFCKKAHTMEIFQDHIITHFRQGNFACNQCDRVFRKLGHLNSHVTIMHKEELSYQCIQCNKGFTSKYSHDCHILTHKTTPEEFPHKCQYCDKRYANKQFLRRHLFKHSSEKKHWTPHLLKKCKVCLRTFETFEELENHRTAADCEPALMNLKKSPVKYWQKKGLNKPISKELCAFCGASVRNISQHMKQIHKPKDEKSQVKQLCPLCGATVNYLKQHMKSHEPKEPVECDICHKTLASKLTLVKHIRMHTGEKPYHCKFCEKKFKDVYAKTVHERTHEGVRNHVCPICSKGFLEKSYMAKHLRTLHK